MDQEKCKTNQPSVLQLCVDNNRSKRSILCLNVKHEDFFSSLVFVCWSSSPSAAPDALQIFPPCSGESGGGGQLSATPQSPLLVLQSPSSVIRPWLPGNWKNYHDFPCKDDRSCVSQQKLCVAYRP